MEKILQRISACRAESMMIGTNVHSVEVICARRTDRDRSTILGVRVRRMADGGALDERQNLEILKSSLAIGRNSSKVTPLSGSERSSAW